MSDSRTYTPFGEPASYRAQVGAAPVFEVAYVRDALGRITQKTEAVEGVTTVRGYGYDLAGRLEVVTENGVEIARYTYDPNGNRLSATKNGVTETAEYDAQDRLVRYGATTYTYTANGELRTKTDATGTTTYLYDAAGNLLRVDLADGTIIEYVIDGQNRRVGRKVNGLLVQGWLYRDQLKPVAEIDGAGNVVARFVYGSHLLVPDYILKGGATYRVIADHLGSPRLVVDVATGAVVQRRDYDAWGTVLADTSPGVQPFGFAGGIHDLDTKLTRFGARDYDAQIGRWTAKDPVGFAGASNLYRYVLNDPTNLVDPTGLIDLDIPGARGETRVFANPGPEAIPRPVPGAPVEHGPLHVHLGHPKEGPRVRVDTFEPLEPRDAERMTKRQRKFCRALTDAQRALIRERAAQVFRFGRYAVGALWVLPGTDSMTTACRQNPEFCFEALEDATRPLRNE